MHAKLSHVYGPVCSHSVQLGLGDDIFKKLKKAFDKAAKFIHEKGGFTAKDLLHAKVAPLLEETRKVFKSALDAGIKTEVPDTMMDKLLKNIYVFSGMKTYAQLKEASLLLSEDGKVKPYYKFEQDILSINEKYNRNYLLTEYNYATGSAEAAAKYVAFAKDGDAYNLQVRTAGDDKVRDSHAVLQNLTLPFSDAFWKTHWVPFDWGCRCNIVQVLKGKYEVTDSAEAVKQGNRAVPEMFRYNPALQAAIFPPKHPYYKTSQAAMKIIKEHLP